MSAPVNRGAFAHKLPRAVTFRAWRICPLSREALPIELAADDWEDALNAALPGANHKDVIAVLRKDDGADEQIVRFYAIKQRSKATWVRKPGFAHAVQHRPLYTEQMFELAVEAFDPVAPFDAFRDGAVGRDLQLVEQR